VFKLHQPRMGEIKGYGHAGHAVGREELARKPEVRAEREAVLLQLAIDLAHAGLQHRAAERQPQIAQAQLEQLFVR